ncbi:hypothetical protein MLD38_030825 [Melastoma candidum]|uniref:Uncharacterized protein n=1 Tax=Melastoma candidum TaxID=119954 RepID=A0ACB9MMB1_9MYRT|nr:hypothetical protein MLD38_030825 [Melastoma candidum]
MYQRGGGGGQHHGNGSGNCLIVFFFFFFSLFLFLISLPGSESATFTFVNDCGYTVWPGILSNAGTPQPSTTGFILLPGQSAAVSVPPSWSGRMWGRTSCMQNATTGLFSCLTGDCGASTVECSGAGAIPPATLVEFTLNGADGLDFYDVSLVDGYNLPLLVVPRGGTSGNCSVTGCAADLNASCPKELQVEGNGKHVACKSACDAFRDAQYCCSGSFSTPSSCKPSKYSEFFKSACPKAYSYAYDDGTSTFTCSSANYVITFCPSPSGSTRVAGDYPAEAAAVTWPGNAYTMPQASGAGSDGGRPPVAAYVAAAVVLAVGIGAA